MIMANCDKSTVFKDTFNECNNRSECGCNKPSETASCKSKEKEICGCNKSTDANKCNNTVKCKCNSKKKEKIRI